MAELEDVNCFKAAKKRDVIGLLAAMGQYGIRDFKACYRALGSHGTIRDHRFQGMLSGSWQPWDNTGSEISRHVIGLLAAMGQYGIRDIKACYRALGSHGAIQVQRYQGMLSGSWQPWGNTGSEISRHVIGLLAAMGQYGIRDFKACYRALGSHGTIRDQRFQGMLSGSWQPWGNTGSEISRHVIGLLAAMGQYGIRYVKACYRALGSHGTIRDQRFQGMLSGSWQPWGNTGSEISRHVIGLLAAMGQYGIRDFKACYRALGSHGTIRDQRFQGMLLGSWQPWGNTGSEISRHVIGLLAAMGQYGFRDIKACYRALGSHGTIRDQRFQGMLSGSWQPWDNTGSDISRHVIGFLAAMGQYEIRDFKACYRALGSHGAIRDQRFQGMLSGSWQPWDNTGSEISRHVIGLLAAMGQYGIRDFKACYRALGSHGTIRDQRYQGMLSGSWQPWDNTGSEISRHVIGLLAAMGQYGIRDIKACYRALGSHGTIRDQRYQGMVSGSWQPWDNTGSEISRHVIRLLAAMGQYGIRDFNACHDPICKDDVDMDTEGDSE